MSTVASNPIVRLTGRSINLLGYQTPIQDHGMRLWVARVFWNSGMTKIQSWDTTLMLFEYEYAVPILPFELAAILATGVELVAPVLLLLGLGTRFGALALFVLNYVAAIAYPDISAAGLKDHYLWGALLAVTFFHGPGMLSVDHWLAKKLRDKSFN
jgi:putative oxidoreductase